jgi:hypothetical protein
MRTTPRRVKKGYREAASTQKEVTTEPPSCLDLKRMGRDQRPEHRGRAMYRRPQWQEL